MKRKVTINFEPGRREPLRGVADNDTKRAGDNYQRFIDLNVGTQKLIDIEYSN